MNNILLSNNRNALVKDPIINDFIKKSTDLILAGINQEILAAAAPKIYKYKPQKIRVGKKKAIAYDTPGAVIVKHIDLKKHPNSERFVKRITRDSLLSIRSRSLLSEQVNLKRTKPLVSYADLVKKTFFFTPLKKVDHDYLLKYLARFASDEQESKPEKQNQKLELYLKQIKCIDETNPERWGRDEIAMGCVFLDPEGNNSTLPEFEVERRFNDGDVENYHPSKLLKSFHVLQSDEPQFYTALITLAEKDSGGMSSFIDDLYQAVRAQAQLILETLGAAAGAYIGGKIGGSVGTAIAGPLGTAIGIIAGAILGAVIGELIKAFKDDIFPPQVATIGLPTSASVFENGRLDSPWKYLQFEGHGGLYQVKYKWKLRQ